MVSYRHGSRDPRLKREEVSYVDSPLYGSVHRPRGSSGVRPGAVDSWYTQSRKVGRVVQSCVDSGGEVGSRTGASNHTDSVDRGSVNHRREGATRKSLSSTMEL